MWAGTGEAWIIRYSDVMGDGVYKSTDGGATWKNMGLKETGRIATMVVHPTDPNVVQYVCAVGRATGPQEARGAYKTTDGGANWTRVLFVNPDTGCSGLSMDASGSQHADCRHVADGAAHVGRVQRQCGQCYTGTSGSGVHITHDGGATWKKVEVSAGMPKPPVGKIDVAIAASNS